MAERAHSSGFTLVELITVLVIVGIMTSFLALLVIQPFRAADDITQRARLTDQADLVVGLVRREVRTALPNSVRVESDGDRTAVEFVPTEQGGRYRRRNDPGNPSDRLNRARDNDTFDVLGRLPDIGAIKDTGTGGIDCATDDRDCMNIFNTGQTDNNVYAGDNIAEIVGVNNPGGPDFTDDQLVFDDNGTDTPTFANHSPQQRFFVFRDVVSFVCDTGSNELLRYSTYGLMNNQPVTDSEFDSTVNVDSNLVADDLSTCNFSYNPGAATRQGLLQIEIGLTRNNETVELFGQVHVVNVP